MPRPNDPECTHDAKENMILMRPTSSIALWSSSDGRCSRIKQCTGQVLYSATQPSYVASYNALCALIPFYKIQQ